MLELDLSPEQYWTEALLRESVAHKLDVPVSDLQQVRVVRRSLDSRKRDVKYHVQLEVALQGESPLPSAWQPSAYQDCSHKSPLVIVGAGPAGLFAALGALEVGLRPIIIDRGKPVEQRKYDISRITRAKEVNPDSNWCFGEGGAGTYSDGKLFTRSTKRGDVKEVLRKFVENGADPDIMLDAHAHIGTDRLSRIIANMRNTIETYGGEYHFDTRVADLILKQGRVCGVRCADGISYEGVAVILATGHSARDIYQLFFEKGWQLEPKPFALGVRVEHSQHLINSIQYHSQNYSRFLPPAAYSLTTQVNGHGVFSFCMCPGGIIVPAATGELQQVVNGMSNSHRNSPFANSGIAVTVAPEDVPDYARYGVFSLLKFQQDVERKVFEAAGGCIDAPSQRLTDFCQNRTSTRLNKSNYMGQCVSAPLHEVLPDFVVRCLQQGFRDFDRKMHGFYTQEASLLAVESRTSSPVRIPRDASLQHPQLPGLYPSGEGAGYAGGIVSSALDGINSVSRLITEIA